MFDVPSDFKLSLKPKDQWNKGIENERDYSYLYQRTSFGLRPEQLIVAQVGILVQLRFIQTPGTTQSHGKLKVNIQTYLKPRVQHVV